MGAKYGAVRSVYVSTAVVEPSNATGVSYKWYIVDSPEAALAENATAVSEKSSYKITGNVGKYARVVVSGANNSTAKAASDQIGKPTVTIADGIANGSVTTNKTSDAPGETITLTITPAGNYGLGTLTVTTVNSNETVMTTMASATSYTFVMPEDSVTVSAAFAEDGSLDNAITVKKGQTDIASAITDEAHPYDGFDTVTIDDLSAAAKSGTVSIVFAKKTGEGTYGSGESSISESGTYKVTFSVSGASSAYTVTKK